MRIILSTGDGRNIEFKGKATMTLDKLKQKIKHKTGIPSDRQCVVLDSNDGRHGETLDESGLWNESSVILVFEI